ncbi:hypothetical protein ACFFNY_01160 [Paenibacillus hodogayensis]|uniref:Uncharacterized protein n=1 Tax=Paenibacillus hodogayensis TaxID=279208 RepID=A0ABV5VPG6_9BACL
MTSYFEGDPLRLGEGPQLLLDDSLIEDRWKLNRVLHRPTNFVKNPILCRDKPWEGDMAFSPWVIWDDDLRLFRMWYECFSLSHYWKRGNDPIYWMCYAESEDGIHWIKPLLDVCPFPGYEKTNVVYCGTHRNRVQGVQIIKNGKTSDPGKNYMMVCLEGVPRNGSMSTRFAWRIPRTVCRGSYRTGSRSSITIAIA